MPWPIISATCKIDNYEAQTLPKCCNVSCTNYIKKNKYNKNQKSKTSTCIYKNVLIADFYIQY